MIWNWKAGKLAFPQTNKERRNFLDVTTSSFLSLSPGVPRIPTLSSVIKSSKISNNAYWRAPIPLIIDHIHWCLRFIHRDGLCLLFWWVLWRPNTKSTRMKMPCRKLKAKNNGYSLWNTSCRAIDLCQLMTYEVTSLLHIDYARRRQTMEAICFSTTDSHAWNALVSNWSGPETWSQKRSIV